MQNFDKAKKAFKTVLCKVNDSRFYEGIEMVLLKKEEKYTEDIGIKIFVNSELVTNSDLSIPSFVNDTKIIVEYKVLRTSWVF